MPHSTAMSDDEKAMRRSFRIREQAFIRYRALSEQEFERHRRNAAAPVGNKFRLHARMVDLEARFRDAYTRLGKVPAPIKDCLSALNDKINLLLDDQPDRKAAMEKLAQGPALTCEIGATGVRFDGETQLAEGAKIFIQIMLPADRHYLECVAVVRREKSPLNDDPQRPHGMAAEFVGLSEAESELLIKHLFQRESESLRMRRLQFDRERG